MIDDALHLRDTLRRIETTLNEMAEAHRRPPQIGVVTSDGKSLEFQFKEMPTLDALETAYIRYVLARCGDNKSAASQCLGIDPSTLYRKLARLEQATPNPSET
jgi:DNA-binding NtrC family response regulator